MRETKEVLRLHYELGLGQRQIARCCSVSQSTVHDNLKRAETADMPWPLPPSPFTGGAQRVGMDRLSI